MKIKIQPTITVERTVQLLFWVFAILTAWYLTDVSTVVAIFLVLIAHSWGKSLSRRGQ